jgi:hypothetical protein
MSSFCGGGGNNCVELAATADRISIRESTEPHIVLTTSRERLGAFIQGLKAGEFDTL